MLVCSDGVNLARVRLLLLSNSYLGIWNQQLHLPSVRLQAVLF